MLNKNSNDISIMLKRLQEAKNELLDVLDDWHYMKHILKPRLDFTYDAIFGDYEFELNLRINHAVELDRRIEIISFKLNKGEQINPKTLKSINNIVERENKNKSELSNDWNFKQNQSSNPEELSTLYRQLVKRIHPDAAGENNDLFQYWENVQSSYKTGDLNRIKLFYQTICKEVLSDIQNNQDEERILRNEIASIETNIIQEKKKIDKLKTEEPFCFQDRFKDNNWVQTRIKLIQDRILNTEMKIQRNKRYISRFDKTEPSSIYFKSQNSNSSFKQSYAS
jgi:hypothetical protein